MSAPIQDLYIKGEINTFFTPNVFFNCSTGECEISGESYLENTMEFYEKLIQWIKDFSTTGKPISITFKLTYFNTSSSKGLLKLLESIKDYEDHGGKVTVNWYYSEATDDMKEEGEDFILDTGLKFNMIPN